MSCTVLFSVSIGSFGDRLREVGMQRIMVYNIKGISVKLFILTLNLYITEYKHSQQSVLPGAQSCARFVAVSDIFCSCTVLIHWNFVFV